MRQKRSHLGCLFWVALILLVIVVFLFNRPKIDQVLATSGLTGFVTKHPPQPAAPQLPPPHENAKPAVPQQPPGSGATGTANPTPAAGGRQQAQPSTRAAAGSKPAPAKLIRQQFDLYFVKIGSGGVAALTPVSRTVDFVDSPLTRTFDILLQGAHGKDQGGEIRSLIPEGTKLLAAAVRDGTAYLDFNDAFRFNPYGVEGYQAQLEQVVFTATQFPSVKRVQILLDGKVHHFLASEGIAIDKPLDRSSFGH